MAQIKGNDNPKKAKKGAGVRKKSVSPKAKNGVPNKKGTPKSSTKSAAERKKTAAEFDVKSKTKKNSGKAVSPEADSAEKLDSKPVRNTKPDANPPVNTQVEEAQPKRRKKKVNEENKILEQNNEVKDKFIEEDDDDLDWSKQTASIIVFIMASLMCALIFFTSDNLWNVMHNFIFGLFGNMAILWDVLLFCVVYMLATQMGSRRIFETVRSAACIFILVDAFSYVFLQSDGYRDTNNKLTGGFMQLFSQIYSDGGKPGGTGLLGGLVGEFFRMVLGKPGAVIFIFLLIIAFIMLLTHTTPVKLFYDMKAKLSVFSDGLTRVIQEIREPEEELDYEADEIEYTDEPYPDEIILETEHSAEHKDEPKPAATLKKKKFSADSDTASGESHEEAAAQNDLDALVNKASVKAKKKTKAEEIQEQKDEFAKAVSSSQENDGEDEYKYPSLKLLIMPKNSDENDNKNELREMAEHLIDTLEEYGVRASISDISRGPTVTRYEIKPAPGVKINKITNLSNDIALRLAAQSIRIEAPIPGKPAVGIEIPNKNKQMVRIREILGSQQFIEAKGALTVALGKDIEGNIVLCDLSKMPHLLIAGSTGSGKSVCVNSMLMSILYKYSPQEVRMVLIDPKSVEFDMYNGIPHLLVPVVCEPKKAAGALQWAVSEMLKRYGMLKEHGARNLDNYNKLAEETGEFEKMCRIVIVIDEMADLMIASPKEVEDAIARLAAMARAAGMHMVLATQRPSVDVITGTIKNNIPSRIALAVSSQIDSRTILDEGGAENLIGYGDMLYHPMGNSKHIRVQGCFVDDREVERVINFIKQNGAAEYDVNIADEIERNSIDNAGDNPADFSDKDPLFMAAVEVVTEAGQASTSMLQRRLSVGYARAGRIIDQLEENGVIGPYEGSKPRAVLITHAQWLEMTMNNIPSGKDDPIVRSHSEFAAQTLDNGHEEITARQSEFFNAKEVDDDDVVEEHPEENTTVSPEEKPSASVRDFTKYFDEDSGESTNEASEKSSKEQFFDEGSSESKSEDEGNSETVDKEVLFSTVTDSRDTLVDDDVPPWEEIPTSHDTTDSEKASDEDEDDFYDAIADAPWVQNIKRKR